MATRTTIRSQCFRRRFSHVSVSGPSVLHACKVHAMSTPVSGPGAVSSRVARPTHQMSLQSDPFSTAARSPIVPCDESYMPKVLKAQTEPGIVRNISTRDFARHISYESPVKTEDLSSTPTVQPRESRVLVLYTGGTIGMRTKAGVYQPEANYLLEAIREIPHLNDKEYVRTYYPNAKLPPYCLPPVRMAERRIVYWVLEYEPLLDSSDMTFDDWIKIAKDIYKAYAAYDGFVVLHGTDTLAYTASALSFMFEDLGKPVVITGAQIPVAEVRSDGRENLVGSLIVAGEYDIPEVTVYFNNKLMRGNRCTKLDNSALDAFQAPNMDPLAEMDIDIKVDWDSVFRSGMPQQFQVHAQLNRNVGMLRIFPSISLEAVKAFLAPPMEGVVLQTFGAGNMPSKRLDIIAALKDAIGRGVVVVNCSQCVRGKVDIHYFTGKILYECGVIGGSDMTVETALVKLSYVLGKQEWTFEEKKKAMRKNLRGELTLPMRPHTSLPDLEILPRLIKFLRISSSEEVRVLKVALFPPLVCSAAESKDIALLEQLKDSGAQLTTSDYDKRTALHVAASAGHLEIVEYLIKNGCSVHARDRWDETPLLSAVHGNHWDVIKLLRQTGAIMTLNPIALGMELCLAASKNDRQQLESWRLAGADLNVSDYDGRTPLHVASGRGNVETVKYLIEQGANPHATDAFECTAIDDAKRHKQTATIEFLESVNLLPSN